MRPNVLFGDTKQIGGLLHQPVTDAVIFKRRKERNRGALGVKAMNPLSTRSAISSGSLGARPVNPMAKFKRPIRIHIGL